MVSHANKFIVTPLDEPGITGMPPMTMATILIWMGKKATFGTDWPKPVQSSGS